MQHADAMREVRRGLGRRLVEHRRQGTTDVSEGVMHNDASVYTDPARFEAEMTKMFRGMPVVACLSTDLPSPGSFRLFDDVGVPILVVRGLDNEVRAFLNVCRHRGARLVRESKGCKKRFTCRFHGWTFGANGRAGNLPQEEHFCGEADPYKDLIACPAAERHGLVFVQATPGSVMDIDAHLGTFGAELAKLDLQEHKRVCEQDMSATSNWKYAFDTYFENYHFASLHRESLGPLFGNTLMLYDTWGPHHRVVYPPHNVEQWEDSETLAASYFVFPNTVIYCGALSPDKMFVNLMRMFPSDVGNLVTHVETFGPAAVADDPDYRTEAEQSLESIVRLVQDEDYDVTAESWANFLSLPEGTTVIYGRNELALQHSHQWFAKAAGYAPPEVVKAKEAAEPVSA